MATYKNKEEMSELMRLKDSVPIEHKLLLTTKEACALSGIAYNTLFTLVNKPDVDFVIKSGKKYLIHREKFEQYLRTITEV